MKIGKFIVGGILLCSSFASAAWAAGSDTVFVKVKSVKLRSSPEYFGAGVATVNYGDALQKVESGKDWWKVKKGAAVGYIPVSALSDKKIVLSGSRAPETEFKSRDVVLAGKGFSKEAEKQLASNDKKLNFAAVNRMEGIKVSDQEMLGFIKSGMLSREG